MVLVPRLDQRQSQSLVMTPQLQQAIKLLQFNNLELAEFVEGELCDNPLLERVDPNAQEQDGLDEPVEDTADKKVEDVEVIDFTSHDSYEIPESEGLYVAVETNYKNPRGSDIPTQNQDISPALAEPGGGGSTDFSGGSGPDLEQLAGATLSLRDHLIAQMTVDFSEPADRLIGLHLIDLVDDAGYITADLEQVGEILGCDLERVEGTLKKLQQFDPPGICARNLAECLALQLQDRDRFDPAMETFINNLNLVAERKMTELGKLCGVDSEDIADMVSEIRLLDPKPAQAFEHDVAQPIVPDILMRAKPGGGWIIELNPDSLPRVLVNNTYFAQVTKNKLGKDEKKYITDHFHSANWLVKAMDQRANTILRVASELVSQQDAFFSKGIQYLKPLVLRDIAEVIEMHESTVSRVTSNKYMVTPRGIYELKFFFTSSINATGGGDAISAESVRFQIKTFIDAELPNKILSDDKLVIMLKKEGIDIARRTVAKYRESMKIPSSVQRRREKSLPS